MKWMLLLTALLATLAPKTPDFVPSPKGDPGGVIVSVSPVPAGTVSSSD